MKIPKSIQSGAETLDAAPLEPGDTEVHLALYGLAEGEPKRLAGAFVSVPRLDELIEIEGDTTAYLVTEVRRSLRGLFEIKPDADGSLEGAYARLAKRGAPIADEIVFVTAEAEIPVDAPEA